MPSTSHLVLIGGLRAKQRATGVWDHFLVYDLNRGAVVHVVGMIVPDEREALTELALLKLQEDGNKFLLDKLRDRYGQLPSTEDPAAFLAKLARMLVKEYRGVFNRGLSTEREREVDQKVAEGRRLYRAARGRGRPHAAALQAANKDGTKKGRWGRSRLYELAAQWKSEWESEQPK